MAELLPRARQTGSVIPKIFPDDRSGRVVRRRSRRMVTSIKISEGPGVLIWRSNPGPPAVTVAWRRAVQQSLYARSPRCCPAPGGRVRGRCRKRFGSSIAGVAGGEPACAARVTAGRSTAGRAAPSSVGRRICGSPAHATKRLGAARTYMRLGNGDTGPEVGCGRGRTKKW
jgi:hypothetical protein